MYILDCYISKWGLIPDGNYISTNSSLIQKCIYNDSKAILKIGLIEEERRGSELMKWWNGDGAARILLADEQAILLENINNRQNTTLVSLVEKGLDDIATKIICNTAKKLHAHKAINPPLLISLEDWFSPLADSHHLSSKVLVKSAFIARNLLLTQKEQCIIHGDLHHENVLLSDTSGWVAIDPKALYGDRAFDYANILCNPNKAVALDELRLKRQLNIICHEADIEFSRMLDWVISWTGLSAIWMLEDRLDAHLPLSICEMALNLKDNMI